ncbi:MAG TPA: hypothetical protein PLI09_10605 [Candidatus Hydrogenedentes bacterium]|nr:hypothetical protein [Candidatus Hydrogenedentota bacterium]
MGFGETASASIATALPDVASWLAEAKAPYCLIGGVAASILGSARTTLDIDVLIVLEETKWDAALALAGKHGLVPRISDCMAFARKSRVLLLNHHPSGVDVDVVIAGLPFEQELVQNAGLSEAGAIKMHVARREDLIIMKAVAQRPRDMADIEGMLNSASYIDWPYIESWVQQFAQALDRSDMVQALLQLKQKSQH